MEKKKCDYCNANFTKPPNYSLEQWTTRRFCSQSCVAKWKVKNDIGHIFKKGHSVGEITRQKIGQAHKGRIRRTHQKDVARFLSKINKTNNCWEWMGKPMTIGYGFFSYDGRQGYAHRFAYTYFNGAIPDGLTIDHLCRNRMCVKPDHLEAVTMGENSMRGGGLQKATENKLSKTHCKWGHEYTLDNTYSKRGIRECIQCRKNATARYKEKHFGIIV